jgi:ATPase subunit of ABC transporter with duplicated ATPase domains
MTSITASALHWATPEGKPVLSGIDIHLSRERIGLVGRNGVGKTTLLRIFSGEIQPTSGKVVVDGRVGVMRQGLCSGPDETIADTFGVADALVVLRRAEDGIADAEELADADWTLEERIREALARVQLSAEPTTAVASLSGGQRTRAALAAVVFDRPDFLLLDEPTNNLDREGREALLRLIESWMDGLCVVSHDRELLERMDAIIELTTLGATRYGGGWSYYRERKAIELKAAHSDLAHAQKHRVEVGRKVQAAAERKQRRDAAGSRKASRGDMPRILIGARKNAAEASGGSGRRLGERLAGEAAEAVAAAQTRIEVLQELSIVLPPTGLHAERKVLEMRDVAAGYQPDDPVLEHVDLEIIGPERIAIAGPNGAGKSTLLKLVSGELLPLSGHVRLGATAAVVDQHVTFLDPAASILDNFRRLNPDSDENSCRAALAGFLFRADAALQIVGTLSGGQMLRAGLACRLGGSSPPQLLILDEPTNHLDIDSIHAVEAALQAYDGALLVVSHDDAFLTNLSIERRVVLGLHKITVLYLDPCLQDR